MNSLMSFRRCFNLKPRSPLISRYASSFRKSSLHTSTRSLYSSPHQPESEHAAPENAHGSHESHYDPPTGWLWGIPPGQKYEKEGWENTWVYGYWGSLILGVVLYAYKPDTSYV